MTGAERRHDGPPRSHEGSEDLFESRNTPCSSYLCVVVKIRAAEERPMIHVIATIELRPGARPAFLEEFARLVPDVRAEAGCLYYAAGVDLPTDIRTQAPIGPDTVVVV